jgi:hypothetical protein
MLEPSGFLFETDSKDDSLREMVDFSSGPDRRSFVKRRQRLPLELRRDAVHEKRERRSGLIAL